MAQYIRFEYQGKTGFGMINGEAIDVLDRNFLEDARLTGEQLRFSDIRLLAPVSPPNILCIGLNYIPHAQETQLKLPEFPLIFLKTTTALAGPDQEILLPKIAPDNVDYEGELVIVIGKTAKNVSEEEADQYIFGYTVGNDVSARDCQFQIDTQWARGKSFDTFAPIGPCITTGIDPNDLKIRTTLNGKIMQDSTTAYLIFNVRKLVSYCSHNMTLLPGTIIMTGTPNGVGFKRVPPVFLQPGDRIEIEIEHIGRLSNSVAMEK